MKILILTQKVDVDDPVLGFFHRWLTELSRHYESIIVICLGAGRVELPGNIRVISLGKRSGDSEAKFGIFRRIGYVLNFFRNILRELRNYESVFVHMNQEYVLLGFPVWKISGKKVMLWRNHPAGSMLTDLAVYFSDEVFCTSRFSYTAGFSKTRLMPVGIDTALFRRNPLQRKSPGSILYLGRISRIKNIDMLIGALNGMKEEGIDFRCDIVGGAYSMDDRNYLDELKDAVSNYALGEKISFSGPVPNYASPDVYNSHEVVVNLSPDGMFDKVIFEAMSSETLVLTSNRNLSGEIGNEFLFEYRNKKDLVRKLSAAVSMPVSAKEKRGKSLRDYVIAKHGLEKLAGEIRKYS